MTEPANTIIREHGNMLDVSIDGKFQTIPKCTCGKCIVRRQRKNEDPSIPYNKDLQSVYTSDYPAKRPIKDKGFSCEDINEIFLSSFFLSKDSSTNS